MNGYNTLGRRTGFATVIGGVLAQELSTCGAAGNRSAERRRVAPASSGLADIFQRQFRTWRLVRLKL
jgi:hypothetical protein